MGHDQHLKKRASGCNQTILRTSWQDEMTCVASLTFFLWLNESKVWTHRLIQQFISIYLLFSTLWIKTGHIHTMKGHTGDHAVINKVLNRPEKVPYFRSFKVATFGFDDRFAHSWLSLNQESRISNSLCTSSQRCWALVWLLIKAKAAFCFKESEISNTFWVV